MKNRKINKSLCSSRKMSYSLFYQCLLRRERNDENETSNETIICICILISTDLPFDMFFIPLLHPNTPENETSSHSHQVERIRYNHFTCTRKSTLFMFME